MNDEERKEKILSLLQRVPPSELGIYAGGFFYVKQGITFRLVYEKVQGRTVNAAEGGMLVGEGEHAEVIRHLPIEVGAHRVTLSAFDVQTPLASYTETGDAAPWERWTDAQGELKPLSPLFEVYRALQQNYEAYKEAKNKYETEQWRFAGLARLDSLLS